MVLGHESAGIIASIGEGVTHLKVGDPVALEPGVPCRNCDMCKTGKYNLCPDMKFAATPPYDGTLCNYYKHAADFCYKLPQGISLEEGALIEPLSVGIHAVRRGNVRLGDRVFVFGAGAIGLLTAAAAKAAGASHVTIAGLLFFETTQPVITLLTFKHLDIAESKLNFAKTYSADKTIHLTKKRSEGQQSNDFARQQAEEILNEHGVEPVNVVFDCTGAEVCVQMSVYVSEFPGIKKGIRLLTPYLARQEQW